MGSHLVLDYIYIFSYFTIPYFLLISQWKMLRDQAIAAKKKKAILILW